MRFVGKSKGIKLFPDRDLKMGSYYSVHTGQMRVIINYYQEINIGLKKIGYQVHSKPFQPIAEARATITYSLSAKINSGSK